MSTFPATASLPQSGSVVSRWLMDEASGNAIDETGSNDLTDNNTVGAGTGYSNATSGVSFDNSRDFERANSEYFSITDASQTGLDITSGLTMAMWINVESTAGTMYLGGKQDNDVANGNTYLFFINGAAQQHWVVSDGSSTDEVIASGAVSTATWTHWVFVYEPSTRLELYEDGGSIATNTTGIVASLNNNAYPFRLGAGKTGGGVTNYYDGLMQDAIIWSTALTDAEVSELHDLYTTAQAAEVVQPNLLLLGVG